jgi:hypothetical protein
MRTVRAAVAALFLGCTAFAATDRTDAVLNQLRAKGLTEISVADAAGIKIKLHRTASAEAIIQARNFDVKDEAFDEAAFQAFVIGRFAPSLEYFRGLVPQRIVDELHVVIDDFGEDRKGNTAQTGIMSRVISCDVRRWHKLYKGYRSYLADLVAIHEFTHVNNYFLDDGETKTHRELVAIVFESLSLIRQYGEETYRKNYLKKVTSPLAKPEHVLGEAFQGQNPLRYVAHAFLKKVSYADAERFAREYLVNRATGAKGFDEAAKRLGITINEVRAGLY